MPLKGLVALAVVAADALEEEPEMAVRVVEALKRPGVRAVIHALNLLKEVSALQICREFELPESSVYRALKLLRELGIVEVVRYVDPSRRGGRRTAIYRLRRR